MPENEFTEFQRRVLAAVDRVLAAVERPKRGRLLAIINSSFFIWLMSVLLLTIGGSYITNHKQCLDDAEKIISRRDHLEQELHSRQADYHRHVTEAKTYQEAFSMLQDKGGSIFTDLAPLSYSEVEGELLTLTKRTRYAEFHDPDIINFVRERNNLINDYATKFHIMPPRGSADNDDYEAHSLKLQKLHAKVFFALQTFEYAMDTFVDFRPDCSVAKTAAMAFGARVPIVFADFDDGPILQILKLAIKDIEQAQKDAQLFEGRRTSPASWVIRERK